MTFEGLHNRNICAGEYPAQVIFVMNLKNRRHEKEFIVKKQRKRRHHA